MPTVSANPADAVRTHLRLFSCHRSIAAGIDRLGAHRRARFARRHRAVRDVVGLAVVVAAGDTHCAVSPTAGREVLGSLAAAAACRSACRNGDPAVGHRRRPAGNPARCRNRPLFLRKLPAPHRTAARNRCGRYAAGVADRAVLATTRTALHRCQSHSVAVDHPEGYRREGRRGGVARDRSSGTPPAEIRERFPNLVPDVPRPFEALYQGRTPLLRIGWASSVRKALHARNRALRVVPA